MHKGPANERKAAKLPLSTKDLAVTARQFPEFTGLMPLLFEALSPHVSRYNGEFRLSLLTDLDFDS